MVSSFDIVWLLRPACFDIRYKILKEISIKKTIILISLLLSSMSAFPYCPAAKNMEANDNKIKYQFFDEQGKSHTVDKAEYDGRANDYARLYPKDQMRMVDKHGQSGLLPAGEVEEAIKQGYRPFTISYSAPAPINAPLKSVQPIGQTIENKARMVMIIVSILLVILFFKQWIKKRNKKRTTNVFTHKGDCDSKTRNNILNDKTEAKGLMANRLIFKKSYHDIMNEKNEFQTKTLGEKLYNLFKSMKKAKTINSIINKSIITIITIYLACMLYLFALNGRYKPIGNSEYGLYKDTWTGKIHSAFMEYGKNPQ